MANKLQNRQLFELLQRNDTLKAKGFSMACTESAIVIDRAGHVHGIWDHDADGYKWVSPGSSEPRFRTADPTSAMLYTVIVLGQE